MAEFSNEIIDVWITVQNRKTCCTCTLDVAHCTFSLGYFAQQKNVWLTNPSHNCATNSEIKWTAQFHIQLVISKIWEEGFYFFGSQSSNVKFLLFSKLSFLWVLYIFMGKTNKNLNFLKKMTISALNYFVRAQGCKESILVQTHKCPPLIMGLQILK